jgi:iron complex transport system ATP-binding protein
VRVLDALGALAESGHAVVYSTHDPNHALRLASQVLLMMPDGRSQIGSVGEVVCLRYLTEAYAVRIDDAFTPDGRRVISWTASDRQPAEGPAVPPGR